MKINCCVAFWLSIGHCLVALALAQDPAENEIDNIPESKHHLNPKSPASFLPAEVDILQLINVTAKDQGVSRVEGPIAKYPAYKFRLPYGNMPLNNSTVVADAMNKTDGFTLVFLYRQQKNNLGTLISVNSPGRLTPWLQVMSNSKTGILTLKYKLQGSQKLRQLEWSLPRHHKKSPLAAWIWSSLTVDYASNVVRLDLDCEPSQFYPLDSPEQNNQEKNKIGFPVDSLIYFRQEPGRKKKFLGSLQVAKVLPYTTHERMWTCLKIASNLAPELRKPVL